MTTVHLLEIFQISSCWFTFHAETMSVFIIFLITQATISLAIGNPCSYEENFTRSSTIRTTANHMLSGFTFRSQRVYDILRCAQACLADNRCLSFNFEDRIDGECQLNNHTAVAQGDSLHYSKRFTYGEMQNVSVIVLYFLTWTMVNYFQSLVSSQIYCDMQEIQWLFLLFSNLAATFDQWSLRYSEQKNIY